MVGISDTRGRKNAAEEGPSWLCMPVDLPQRGRNRLKGKEGLEPLNSAPVNRV